MTVRAFLLWVQDFLFNKSEIRKNLNDIEQIILDGHSTKLEYIDKLLEHSTRNIPFYKSYVNKNLSEFPIINKSIIRENKIDFLINDFDSNKVKAVTTSGSTGTPFTVYHDRRKRIRHSADNLFFMKFAGYTIGSPLFYFRVWNKYCRHSAINSWLTNIKQVEIGDLSNNVLRLLLNDINKPGKKSMLAFASTYSALLHFINHEKISSVKAEVETIISMSEHLPEDTRREIRKIFKAPVVSRYSNMENGFIAQQPKDESFYIINNASYKVELLDLEEDTPVELNKVGRIVVTDLFNYTMPLIRYDTGDIGVFKKVWYKGKELIVLASIEGRKVDSVFQTNGDLASSHVITNSMWPYKEIKQWQFIQIGKTEYKFLINGILTSSEKCELEQTLREYLGKDACFEYEFVNDIPVLSSGKRKMIVNLMKS